MVVAGAWSIACGPTVNVDVGDSADSSSSTTATTVADSGPNPSTSSPMTTPATTEPGTTVGSTVTTDATVADTANDSIADTGELPEWCDLFTNDCPEGYKCMPWANDGGNNWNDTKCSPLDPNPRAVGESCTVEGSGVSGVDDCEAHSMCWDVDPETNMGECTAFCSGSEANPICDDACASCSISGDGVLILCLPACDPLVPDTCGDDVCVPFDAGFACAPDASGKMGAAGEPCEFVNVCDPGLFCATSDMLPDCDGATGCCSPFCDLDVDGSCAAMPGTVCMPWSEDGLPEGCSSGTVGACVVP